MDYDRLRERAAVIDMEDQFQRCRENAYTSWGWYPIGYGRMAETAAEPVEFSRLIQHLEREHLVTEWHDTIPTAPMTLGEQADCMPACAGACAKEGKACRRPRACWLTTSESADDGMGAIRGALWAIGPVIALALLGVLVGAIL